MDGCGKKSEKKCDFFIKVLDIKCAMLYSTFINTFPDCVMVALQILVLTVGVRILLGELILVPSSIG